MSTAGREPVFNIGEKVVYPQQGVGSIVSLETRNTREYYRVKIESSEMDVLLPVQNAATAGLRHLTSQSDVKKALASLAVKKESSGSDWKARLQANQELMREGTLLSVAQVVNTLYHRSKVKELPVQERKLYDNALSLLVDESSYVLGIGKEEMKKKIFMKLER